MTKKTKRNGAMVRFKPLVPTGLPQTDAEWAEHDRRLQGDLDRADGTTAALKVKGGINHLLSMGLSLRHLKEIYTDQISITETVAMAAARSKAATVGIWCLSGSVGCGKTFAAHYWLLNRGGGLLDPAKGRWANIAMVSAVEFARISRYDSERYDGMDKFAHFGGFDRLVIDDLGVEFLDSKGSFLTDLDELLDLRWKNERPTLITTNLGKAIFKERYEGRIADRIRDKGGWINSAGESMRSNPQLTETRLLK